ncbi:MAG: polymer-forming cytoskeletal protein, partial [Proteobacteria bacterium]|nr:polymer-forming cytoskeletal protein [Pseudomonadota bacterium]
MLGKIKKRKPNKVDSLIGQNSRMIGDIRFGGGLHVDGSIKGSVIADADGKATLTVSDRGTIEGEVR